MLQQSALHKTGAMSPHLTNPRTSTSQGGNIEHSWRAWEEREEKFEKMMMKDTYKNKNKNNNNNNNKKKKEYDV